VSHSQIIVRIIQYLPLQAWPQIRAGAWSGASAATDTVHRIINICHCRAENGKLCIVTELASGGDLQEKIKSRKGVPLPEPLILTWLVELASALHYCHARKVLHRDLKSANIFLSADSTLRLGDFGIARVLKYTLEQAKTFLGTPYYMSPELALGRPYNGKSDVWAVGCILYEMAMQRHPFDGSSMQSLVRRIVRGRFNPITATYSANLRGLVNLMLSTTPSARPAIGAILQLPFLQPYVRSYIRRCRQRGVPLPDKALPEEIASHYAALEASVPRSVPGAGSRAVGAAGHSDKVAAAVSRVVAHTKRPGSDRPIAGMRAGHARVIDIGEPEPGSARTPPRQKSSAEPTRNSARPRSRERSSPEYRGLHRQDSDRTGISRPRDRI